VKKDREKREQKGESKPNADIKDKKIAYDTDEDKEE
jgi:hypothetical protein